MAFPGDPRGYPGKDAVADYLLAYARRFRLPVEPSSPVISVRRDLSHGFAMDTGRLELSTRQASSAGSWPFELTDELTDERSGP